MCLAPGVSPVWRSCLQNLATRLRQVAEPVEALVTLAADAEDLPLLDGRVAAFALCGLAQPRLWLEQPLRAETCWWIDGHDGSLCRLLLPGLVRENLRVRQADHQLLIRSVGSQLNVPLPPERAQLTCPQRGSTPPGWRLACPDPTGC